MSTLMTLANGERSIAAIACMLTISCLSCGEADTSVPERASETAHEPMFERDSIQRVRVLYKGNSFNVVGDKCEPYVDAFTAVTALDTGVPYTFPKRHKIAYESQIELFNSPSEKKAVAWLGFYEHPGVILTSDGRTFRLHDDVARKFREFLRQSAEVEEESESRE